MRNKKCVVLNEEKPRYLGAKQQWVDRFGAKHLQRRRHSSTIILDRFPKHATTCNRSLPATIACYSSEQATGPAHTGGGDSERRVRPPGHRGAVIAFINEFFWRRHKTCKYLRPKYPMYAACKDQFRRTPRSQS